MTKSAIPTRAVRKFRSGQVVWVVASDHPLILGTVWETGKPWKATFVRRLPARPSDGRVDAEVEHDDQYGHHSIIVPISYLTPDAEDDFRYGKPTGRVQ